jgi:hypothetical protein
MEEAWDEDRQYHLHVTLIAHPKRNLSLIFGRNKRLKEDVSAQSEYIYKPKIINNSRMKNEYST